VDDQEFERARDFKLLGSVLTEDFNITVKFKWRIVIANQISYVVKKQLYS